MLWRPSKFGRRKAVWCLPAPVAGLEAVKRWWISGMPPFGCCSVTLWWPGPLVWTQSSWLGEVRVGPSLYLNHLTKAVGKVYRTYFAPGDLILVCCTAPEGGGGICFWLSYQGLVVISLPRRRKNLFRGSGLCKRKEVPNEGAQSLRENFFLHKKLEQC